MCDVLDNILLNLVASVIFLVGYEFIVRPLLLYLRSKKIAGDYIVCNPVTRKPLTTQPECKVRLETSIKNAGMFEVSGIDNLGQGTTRTWKGSLRFDPIALEFASGQYNYTQGPSDAGWHAVIRVVDGKEYLVQTTAIHFPQPTCFLWLKRP